MDSIAPLVADHNRLRGLFAGFKTAKQADDAASMEQLESKIASESAVHTTLEEETFFPWARDLSEEIAASIPEGVEEHAVVKMLQQEIAALGPTSDEWLSKVTVVLAGVEHHAGEEEMGMFPAIRPASSGSVLNDQAALLETPKATLGAPVLEHKIDVTIATPAGAGDRPEPPGTPPSTMGHDKLAATVAPA